MNHITDGAFQCFTQDSHEVTFRARLHATPTTTPMQLINYVIHWIEEGASVALSGILLSVDEGCDVVIESFSKPECSGQPLTTHAIAITTTEPEDDSVTMATSQQSTTTLFTEAAIPVAEPTTVSQGTKFILHLCDMVSGEEVTYLFNDSY